MPINQNTYNTRLTDENLEAAFRQQFKSQGGAELVDDLYASGVIVPIINLSDATAGGSLPVNLQTAWDFSTGSAHINNATNTVIINNTGFWKVDLVANSADPNRAASVLLVELNIWDGATSKPIYQWYGTGGSATNTAVAVTQDAFVVFLRAGDSLRGTSTANVDTIDVSYRQIADVNGNLTNPLGFTF